MLKLKMKRKDLYGYSTFVSSLSFQILESKTYVTDNLINCLIPEVSNLCSLWIGFELQCKTDRMSLGGDKHVYTCV
ncbi:hypothetical protein AB3S75_024710 [Citrus x aurantiifolia]